MHSHSVTHIHMCAGMAKVPEDRAGVHLAFMICATGTLNKPLPTASHVHQPPCNAQEAAQLGPRWGHSDAPSLKRHY